MQGTYMPWLLCLSAALAIAVSYTTLHAALRVSKAPGRRGALRLFAAAVGMGVGIWSAQFLGMLALPAPVHVPAPILLSSLAVAIFTAIGALLVARRAREGQHGAAHVDSHAQYALSHDPLTGLPNRLALIEATEQAMAKPGTGQFALLVLNVDRLKPINDSLGHHAGDELLRELANRVHSVLRRGDMLTRLAGDEFTILAADLRGEQDAEVVANKVLEAMRTPFFVAPLEIHASVSIGVSMFPGNGRTFDVLLRRAEAAMRYAKDSARGGFRFYAEEMSKFADDRLALEADLRRAIEAAQLELHYQPKVDIPTGRIRSAEALIRWRHPTRGLVPPGDFISIAEETGLIVDIGEWVLREACRQMREWLDAGMSPVRIAVNLSAKQFRHADLAAIVRSALEMAQLQPGYLELELTESAVMQDPEKSAATLQKLSTMGVHISIDDFGTGYSSLSYLRRFPLDKLKIDRSFIRDLLSNPDDVSIVRAIISLAHSLRLRVVAEGVETAEQLAFLRDLGCDQYQGYFCSPAVPAAAFCDLLKRLRSEREYTEADMLSTQSRLSAFTTRDHAA
jgi:diguanylate cyclase (GGDEF)-like protein